MVNVGLKLSFPEEFLCSSNLNVLGSGDGSGCKILRSQLKKAWHDDKATNWRRKGMNSESPQTHVPGSVLFLQ